MQKLYDDLYQHTMYREDVNISDHLYLLQCSRPTLIHTGFHETARAILPELDALLNGQPLSYIFVSHLGADECGGLSVMAEKYPHAQVICSDHTARELRGFGVKLSLLIATPGERIAGDDFSFRVIEYPSEAHLQSGLLLYEENRGIFFSSDLMMRSGDGAGAVQTSDWKDEIRATGLRQVPNRYLLRTLRRDLGLIDPRFVAVGHGFCLKLV